VSLKDRILVIKLGALGDFMQAAGPFGAIRQHHSTSEITLLTTIPYRDFALKSPWFNEIKIDPRPGLLEIKGWLEIKKWLAENNFSRVYDLQTSDRTSFYFNLMRLSKRKLNKLEWSGIARGCSHPHKNINRDLMHTIERQREQLLFAGINKPYKADFSWIKVSTSKFNLEKKFIIIAPSGSMHRKEKRWPRENFQKIINHIGQNKIQTVLIGSLEEKMMLNDLAMNTSNCISLAGQTNLLDLYCLFNKSLMAIGNDSGPMHIAALSGCKTIVIFSNASDPALCGQRGRDVTIVRKNNLLDITSNEIIELLEF
tara:strand:+ start:4054 stop:4992 length:939 start_codon:yes stop_codon:yes gene_type:complete